MNKSATLLSLVNSRTDLQKLFDFLFILRHTPITYSIQSKVTEEYFHCNNASRNGGMLYLLWNQKPTASLFLSGENMCSFWIWSHQCISKKKLEMDGDLPLCCVTSTFNNTVQMFENWWDVVVLKVKCFPFCLDLGFQPINIWGYFSFFTYFSIRSQMFLMDDST